MQYKKHEMIKILKNSMPNYDETGILTHLRDVVAPKSSKGKRVDFTFRKRDFYLTASLKVHEFLFGKQSKNMIGTSELTEEIENKLKAVAPNLAII